MGSDTAPRRLGALFSVQSARSAIWSPEQLRLIVGYETLVTLSAEGDEIRVDGHAAKMEWLDVVDMKLDSFVME